ncbi:hypothetical protein BDN72DRAFT_965953 [Pluteus cervinus]|uniref:Uncharacterized protein n=1 Tax=Pluteus cervinus TaxID=181527 RepID=A0ACD3A260_9AGAR|nr:hypothetical protein BDN72DRAFT_965953 [Pluteus cervinus]
MQLTAQIPGHKRSSDTLRLDSEQLYIRDLTMEHENASLRRFLVKIDVVKESIVKGSEVVVVNTERVVAKEEVVKEFLKTHESTKEYVRKGKLQWKLNISLPMASKIEFVIMKHHIFKPDEVVTTISVSFVDLFVFFHQNQNSFVMGLQGSQGEKLSLTLEQKSIQTMLERITLPSAVLDKLGKAQEPIKFLLDTVGQLGDLNPIAQGVLTLFSKAFKQLDNQKLCTQQVAQLVEQINTHAPILRKAQKLESYENLQKVVQDILQLIEKVLSAILEYNEKHPIGQIWDMYKHEPTLDSQKFSTEFDKLSKLFDKSLEVDQAYMLEQQHIESVLTKLKPDLKQPAAFCAPDTCSDILAALDAWTKSQPDKASQSGKLFWLYGVAGMGKSTIAATFYNRLKAQKLLGGFHICSRDSTTHQSPTQLVLNLCYQLALVYQPFGRHISKVIETDKLADFSRMPLADVIQLLFVQPLKLMEDHQQRPEKAFVLVIDALDECGSSEERNTLIQNFEQLLGCCDWIKLLITSRPNVNVEQNLKKEKANMWSLDPRNNDSNIQQFFKFMFEQNPEFKIDLGEWAKKIPALTAQAGGLFIWAKTVYEYLRPRVDKFTALDKLLQQKASNNLYVLYETVLKEAIPSEDRNTYKSVMGAVLLSAEPLSEKGLARLLAVQNGLKESIVDTLVSRLKSLIYIGKDRKLYILHPSLREYLTDSQVESEFSIGQEQHHTLFEKTVCVMEQQLKFNICELESSYETNSEVKDLEEKIKRHVSEELQYSARYWMYHMIKSGEGSLNQDKGLEKLGSNNTLLYWIEVLSLLGCVRRTMLELTKAIQGMKANTKSRYQTLCATYTFQHLPMYQNSHG